MTKAGQESREKWADAQLSGLTNPGEVSRPSGFYSVEASLHSMRSTRSFPPRLRRKCLKGMSLSANSLLAGTKNPRAPHGKNS